jgi:hypothetical protein
MAVWGPNGNGSPTLAVDLWGHQNRGNVPNVTTLVGNANRPQRHRDMKEMFVTAYRAFASMCRAVDEPGIAIVAVHESTGRAQGLVTLRARVDRHVAAIVGRHDSSDLYLDRAPELALRHLAIILDPVSSWSRGDSTVRYRVLDLRTERGFADENGRQLRGICCEGPALIRAGGHALFLLPLGDPSDWPDSADDAWGFLPERVYFDELLVHPEGSMRLPRKKKADRKSMIFRTHGPRDTSTGSVATSGTVGGTIDLIGPNLAGQITVGERELSDGVLLGRYARCDSASFVDDPSMSRVHALLIKIDERILLVDTGSVNGTRLVGEHRARVIELSGDTDFQLGKATKARWRFAA